MEDYKTIQAPSEAVYREKASRFMAFAYPVQTEEDVKNHLQVLKKKYHDAVHHCYAFRLGANLALFRSSDDGEPSGTAGKPILGQIQSFELTNVLIVVVRYFGGTKLGVSGLIQAYRQAAADALGNAVIISKKVMHTYEIIFEYTRMNEVLRILKNNQAEIIVRELENTCRIVCEVPLQKETAFLADIDLQHVNIKRI